MSDESRPRTAGGEFAPISALWKVGHALWLRVGWTTARVAQRSPESSGSFGVRKATSALRLQSPEAAVDERLLKGEMLNSNSSL